MKRLYISDLDGTLLTPEQTISGDTAELLNRCISAGAFFTFATARTAASAVKIMADVKVNVPCILMNGVCIYDLEKREYVRTERPTEDKSAAVSELLDRLGQTGFMYKITDNKLYCQFTDLDNPAMEEFYLSRRQRYDKPFEQIRNFTGACNGDVVYFALLDSFGKLDKVRKEIEKIGGLKYEFYRDIYNNDVWYLEIFSETASKKSGVEFLRQSYGFDEIAGFGDNLNDIPLFEACDIKLAVENANPELKRLADIIIPSNTENSVAKWIEVTSKNHRLKP